MGMKKWDNKSILSFPTFSIKKKRFIYIHNMITFLDTNAQGVARGYCEQFKNIKMFTVKNW